MVAKKTKKVEKEISPEVETPNNQEPKNNQEPMKEEQSKEEIPLKIRLNVKYIVFSILALIIIGAIIYTSMQKPKAKDEVVATINDKEIKLSDLNNVYNSIPAEYKKILDKKAILDQLIETEVLYQEAQKKGIKIDQKEAEMQLLISKMSAGLTEEDFKQKLAEQNKSEKDFIEEYVKQLTIRKYLNVTLLNNIDITDKEIKDYYNTNKEQFKIGEKVTVKHILIGDNNLSEEEQKAKTQEILPKITKDNFCEYVKNYSTDGPSIPQCGEYTFSRTDPLVEEFKELSFKQKSGDIGTVQTSFGTHIIWTIKKTQAKTLTLKEATSQIRNLLLAQKSKLEYKSLYENLAKNNNVKITYNELLQT